MKSENSVALCSHLMPINLTKGAKFRFRLIFMNVVKQAAASQCGDWNIYILNIVCVLIREQAHYKAKCLTLIVSPRKTHFINLEQSAVLKVTTDTTYPWNKLALFGTHKKTPKPYTFFIDHLHRRSLHLHSIPTLSERDLSSKQNKKTSSSRDWQVQVPAT